MKTETQSAPAPAASDAVEDGMIATSSALSAAPTQSRAAVAGLDEAAAPAPARRTGPAAPVGPAPIARWLTNTGRALLVPVLAILLWQLVSDPRVKSWLQANHFTTLAAKLPNAQILPPPTKVFTRWVDYAKPTDTFEQWQEKLSASEKTGAWKSSRLRWTLSGELPSDAVASLMRVLIGFVIGGGLALPLGLMMGASDTVYKFFNPLLQVLRPIPPIAYIPLSILWFGLGNPPAYFLISLGAFFPVLVNTISGVRNVDGIFLRAARNLGAKGFTMFWRVILPAATPYILTGVRVGIGVAFIVVIVAEMIAVNSGLGYRILEAREFFWSDKIIAGMFSIGLLGLGLDTLMDRLNNHLLRWHRGADQGSGH